MQREQRRHEVLAQPREPRGLDHPGPIALLVGLAVVPVAAEVEPRRKAQEILQQPDAARRVRGEQLDLRPMHHVHRGLLRLAQPVADEVDELVHALGANAAGIRGIADEILGEEPAPGIPVLQVQETAIARLDLADGLDLDQGLHGLRSVRPGAMGEAHESSDEATPTPPRQGLPDIGRAAWVKNQAAALPLHCHTSAPAPKTPPWRWPRHRANPRLPPARPVTPPHPHTPCAASCW